MTSGYRQTYDRWRADPQAFWAEAAREIAWIRPPERIFDPEGGVYGRWFPDARCNACFNALDRHVEAGRGDQAALYYDSPVAATKRAITYRELLDETATLGAVLEDLGVAAGDRVLIYMPMIPEAIVAMLACARIGAVHSVVFGGFAAKELATRIDDAEPKVVLTASCGIEPGRIVEYKPLLDLAIGLAKHKPATCVVYQRPQIEAVMNAARDHDWTTLVAAAKAAGKRAPCADLAATDPLYILYTSGTTGVPKGVVRDIGGYLVALKWSMSAIYDVKPGETYWAGSDIGWVVGHSYIVYGPLLHGCASVLYEGKPIGTPDAGAFWRVIEDYKVAAFFTAPTALARRAQGGPAGEAPRRITTSRRCARCSSPASAPTRTPSPGPRRSWACRWSTTGGRPRPAGRSPPIRSGLGILPIKLGSPTVPMPGYEVHVVDEAAKPLPAGTMGSIVIKLPLPPGCLPTLYRQDERMRESYLKEFPGYYKTADAGFIDEDGYLTILGRTDDIINVAGHRLSTGGMEEVVASHPDVAECAVLGVKDEIKGEQPCGFLVLKAGVNRPPEEIEKEVVKLVRDRIGPVAAFKMAIVVPRLPKTRSGKILRGTMKKIADQDAWATPATIEDPKALDEIAEALEARAR